MENGKSFNEIEESISQEFMTLIESKLRLKSIFEKIPKSLTQKFHDNYLGLEPTRAVLSGQFHASLNSLERQELLQILSEKYLDDLEIQAD